MVRFQELACMAFRVGDDSARPPPNYRTTAGDSEYHQKCLARPFPRDGRVRFFAPDGASCQDGWMPPSSTALTAAPGCEVARLEPTRVGDDESVGNGNWHLWTTDGEHHILRRYHVLRTEEDLAYETTVLDHLTARGWCVPAQVAGPVWYDVDGDGGAVGWAAQWPVRRGDDRPAVWPDQVLT